jgi:hypothetical protein
MKFQPSDLGLVVLLAVDRLARLIPERRPKSIIEAHLPEPEPEPVKSSPQRSIVTPVDTL